MILQGLCDQDDKYKIALFGSNLAGGALATLHELKKDVINPITFERLVRGLEDMYHEGMDSDIHQQLVFDRKQR